MHRALRLHPDCRRDAVSRIDVDVIRPAPGLLTLDYVLTGRISDIVLPPRGTPARTDDLWKHTCFEVFIRPGTGAPYVEFNFAPSTHWASYRFNGYRNNRRPAEDIAQPLIVVRADDKQLALKASLDLSGLPYGLWHLGLSAVVEEPGGRMSYWALNHPSGNPDFHHHDGFALELAGAS